MPQICIVCMMIEIGRFSVGWIFFVVYDYRLHDRAIVENSVFASIVAVSLLALLF